MLVQNILIVGGGFSGKRFLKIIQHINTREKNIKYNLAVVDTNKDVAFSFGDNVSFYITIDEAFAQKKFDVVIITVNECSHYEILKKIARTKVSLILCEKPLVETVMQAEEIEHVLKQPLSMNMVERFSPVIDEFFKWRKKHINASLCKIEFFWGKNRIRDHRPTIGVISEIIHPLDLVLYIFNLPTLEINDIISSYSDFSVSGAEVTDSVDISASSQRCQILGHSSFTWAHRHREITAYYNDSNALYRVNFIFDEPLWDCDKLKIDKILPNGEIESVLKTQTRNKDFPDELQQIYKVSRFFEESMTLLSKKNSENSRLVSISHAVELQRLLEKMQKKAEASPNVTAFFEGGPYG